MSELTNTPLTLDVKARAQATLPVRFGGLGVRGVVVLAPSAYLSSSAATADLVDAILPPPTNLYQSPPTTLPYKSGPKVMTMIVSLEQVLRRKELGQY